MIGTMKRTYGFAIGEDHGPGVTGKSRTESRQPRLTGRGIGEPCHCWPLVLGTKDASTTRNSGLQRGSANAVTPHRIGSAIAQIREIHLPRDCGVDVAERM